VDGPVADFFLEPEVDLVSDLTVAFVRLLDCRGVALVPVFTFFAVRFCGVRSASLFSDEEALRLFNNCPANLFNCFCMFLASSFRLSIDFLPFLSNSFLVLVPLSGAKRNPMIVPTMVPSIRIIRDLIAFIITCVRWKNYVGLKEMAWFYTLPRCIFPMFTGNFLESSFDFISFLASVQYSPAASDYKANAEARKEFY